MNSKQDLFQIFTFQNSTNNISNKLCCSVVVGVGEVGVGVVTVLPVASASTTIHHVHHPLLLLRRLRGNVFSMSSIASWV